MLARRGVPGPTEDGAEKRLKLWEVRARTLALIEPLSDHHLSRQHSPLQAPILWDLGHIAQFEGHWTSRGLGTRVETFDSIYDPQLHPRRTRGSLPLPDRREMLGALREVRARTSDMMRRVSVESGDPLKTDGFVCQLVAQHEAQHSETILQTIQLIPDVVYAPEWRESQKVPVVSVAGREVLVPGGPFRMGTDSLLAYDNERPAHVRDVPAFRIDMGPVTNGQYRAFLESGAYSRRELWTNEGWEWRCQSGLEQPANWVRGDDGRWGERLLGRIEPLDLQRPVVHVCWYEADAYARWMGKRLPSEAEWEKAASWHPHSDAARPYPWGGGEHGDFRANLNCRVVGPSAVGSYPQGSSPVGCHQMIGDVWEWTASDFEPYPGFTAFPYPEYSEIHFGKGYKVLRGGSWATHPVAVRNTFRNWDLPIRRQIFAGFRCVADV